MINNYEVAYNEEWNKLRLLDLEDISDRLGVVYDTYNNQMIVTYFKEDYILDIDTRKIRKKEDDSNLHIIESISLLNYLTYSNNKIFASEKWVSLKEIPGGGALFYPAFYKSSIKPLIDRFNNKINELENNSIKLQGTSIKMGDVAYEFEVLPKIKIGIVYWQGDEEISSNATVLFQESIKDLVHIETVIGIGGIVVDKLI